jgi:hypothetical protein
MDRESCSVSCSLSLAGTAVRLSPNLLGVFLLGVLRSLSYRASTVFMAMPR